MLRFGPHRTVAAVICWALVVALVTPTASVAGKYRGKVKKGVYHSPHKNFSVPVPGFFLGGRITDHYEVAHGLRVGGVSFHGSMGELVGVLYMETPTGFLPTEENWSRWVRGVALPGWFLQASPEAQILKEEAFSFREKAAYRVLLELPGGAHLMSGKSGKRFDSRRGVVFFVRGCCIYGLMNETLSPPDLIKGNKPPVGADWAYFTRGLESWHDDISFEDPGASGRKRARR